MNKSRTDRIKEAKHYEWLAIKALLPEEVSPRLERIGKELEALVSEGLASCKTELMNIIIKETNGQGEGEPLSGVRKIHIEE